MREDSLTRRWDDPWIELDAEAKQHENGPEQEAKDGDRDDLDHGRPQRGSKGERAWDAAAIDVNRADARSNDRDQGEERPEKQCPPGRPGMFRWEVLSRGESKLGGSAHPIHGASGPTQSQCRGAIRRIVPESSRTDHQAKSIMMRVDDAAQDPGEPFDVVTADGRPTGLVKPRGLVHRDGDWHRAIHVWVMGRDSQGKPFLMFQRRSPRKDTWPDRYDATVGGHFRAGETLTETMREIEEEIGIAPDPADLRFLGVRVCANEAVSGIVDRELQDVFLLRDDRPLTAYYPNPAELAALVRFPIDALLPFLADETGDVRGEAIVPGASVPVAITAHPEDFIPTIDRYNLKVGVAARYAFRGDRYVAI
jgi:isopentenyldiphosphate isomerase